MYSYVFECIIPLKFSSVLYMYIYPYTMEQKCLGLRVHCDGFTHHGLSIRILLKLHPQTFIHACENVENAARAKILDPKHYCQRAATQEANYGLYPNASSSSSSAPRSNRAPNASEIGATADRPVFPASSITAAAARTLHRGENVVRSVSTEPTLVRWHK